MSRPGTPRPPISPARALVAVVVAGLLLRPHVAGIAPLIPDIRADLGGSFLLLGLLTTVPVILMGTFALLAARAAGALGTFRAITVALITLSVAALVRAGSGNVETLVIATIPIGVAMGIAAALAPAVVKETQAHRPARATGAHVAGLIAGSGIATALAIPIAHTLGSWRDALLVFGVLSIVGTLAWVVITGGARGSRPDRTGSAAIPWRRRSTWVIVAIFALQGLLFWGLSTWLATAYQERGWVPAAAGGLGAILNTAPLVGALWFSAFGDRVGTRRQQLTVASIVVVGGTALVAGVPSVAALGALIAGSGLGAQFALAMTLPIDVSDSSREAAGLTGLVFVIGFGSAAITPAILGGLADATGSFDPALWALVGLAVVLLIVGRWTPPRRESAAAPDRSSVSG